jgi:hypothetical protein
LLLVRRRRWRDSSSVVVFLRLGVQALAWPAREGRLGCLLREESHPCGLPSTVLRPRVPRGLLPLLQPLFTRWPGLFHRIMRLRLWLDRCYRRGRISRNPRVKFKWGLSCLRDR